MSFNNIKVFWKYRGLWPSPVVPLTSDIHNHLRDNHVNQTGEVKLLKDENGDAIYYTANRDGQMNWNPTNDATWEKNPVYSYKGDRYVRVTPYAYGTGTAYYYNDTAANPVKIERVTVASGSASNYRWFKVEPIKWIILNANWLPEGTIKNYTGTYAYSDPSKAHVNIELYAADALMSGIPYDLSNVAAWNSSRTMYQYLNNIFYSQAFSGTDKSLIKDSTVYNNTAAGELASVTGLNSNHLTDGSGKNPTEQKIYLLSMYELTNDNSPYIKVGNKVFGPEAATGEASKRRAGGTDYARAHNLMLVSWEGKICAQYWTRSADATSVYCVGNTGGLYFYNANDAILGARPALQLKRDCFVEPLLPGGGLTFCECTHKP